MSTVRTCADCSTQYALDLAACPHCGSSNTRDAEGVATRRLPLYVNVSCPGCGRGPWSLRLSSVATGLLDLPTLACASCGSRVPVTWPPEEEPMSPKITVHGGATNARAADPSPDVEASEPLVGAEADQGHPTPAAEEPAAEAAVEAPEAVAEDAAPVEETAADVDPYADKTLAELRDLAEQRDLATYGTKAQVTERLREADAATVDEDSAE